MVKKAKTSIGKLVVAILDRGWIFVGRVTEAPGYVQISNAACIRYWGTTKGIGELALEGPKDKTRLDEAGTVTVPRTAVIALIDAKEEVWKGR